MCKSNTLSGNALKSERNRHSNIHKNVYLNNQKDIKISSDTKSGGFPKSKRGIGFDRRFSRRKPSVENFVRQAQTQVGRQDRTHVRAGAPVLCQ